MVSAAYLSTKGETVPVKTSVIGTITETHGSVVIISCYQLPPLQRALNAIVKKVSYVFKVHEHLDEHHVSAIALL